jgi:hypothetical protein
MLEVHWKQGGELLEFVHLTGNKLSDQSGRELALWSRQLGWVARGAQIPYLNIDAPAGAQAIFTGADGEVAKLQRATNGFQLRCPADSVTSYLDDLATGIAAAQLLGDGRRWRTTEGDERFNCPRITIVPLVAAKLAVGPRSRLSPLAASA